MNLPKRNKAKKDEPLFPTLVKRKVSGNSDKAGNSGLNFNESSGLRESKGFRSAKLIRKGRAGT